MALSLHVRLSNGVEFDPVLKFEVCANGVRCNANRVR
jgi:hypothetical protein